jgi:hypothetical protein
LKAVTKATMIGAALGKTLSETGYDIYNTGKAFVEAWISW